MNLPLARRLSCSPLGRSAGTQTRGALRYFAQAFVPLSVVL